MPLTRRQLGLGLAGLAVTSTSALALAVGPLSDQEAFRLRTLKDLIGDFDISDDDFRDFSADFDTMVGSRFGPLSGTKWRLVRSADRLGVFDAPFEMPASVTDKLEEYRRALLTQFVLSTDIYDAVGEDGPTVRYYGSAAGCTNPFAEFT